MPKNNDRIIDAISVSGTVYRLNLTKRLWTRFPHENSRSLDLVGGMTEKIWSLKVGTALQWPHLAPEPWEDADEPVIGKHLYLSSKDVWYVSKPIVEIKEVPEWTSPPSTKVVQSE